MRAGHSYADTLITPINESLIDLDVIGKVNPKTIKIESLSPYAETVWMARQKRALNRQPPLNWFVLRNRLMYIPNNNRKLLDKLIEELAKRVSFTPLAGLGERVIYKELFLKGLTILDLRDNGIDIKLGISHIAAKREIENLMEAVTK
jgi:chromosome partitioning protein